MSKIDLSKTLKPINTNPYLESPEEGKKQNKGSQESKIIETEEIFAPKLEIRKKYKMGNFSFYGKEENISKLKKLAKHHGVNPSVLMDSILDAYFNSQNK
ncbi:hypothetical protein ABSA28_00168 [Candidatus Hepatincolaceae symbiont of Richtersius coronifer]